MARSISPNGTSDSLLPSNLWIGSSHDRTLIFKITFTLKPFHQTSLGQVIFNLILSIYHRALEGFELTVN